MVWISLTSVVCSSRLPWNEIQGQSQRKDSEDGGAAFSRPTMLSTMSLALAQDSIPRQYANFTKQAKSLANITRTSEAVAGLAKDLQRPSKKPLEAPYTPL